MKGMKGYMLFTLILFTCQVWGGSLDGLIVISFDNTYEESLVFQSSTVDTCDHPLPDIICPDDLILSCDISDFDQLIDEWIDTTINSFGLDTTFKVTAQKGPFESTCADYVGKQEIIFSIENTCGETKICKVSVEIEDNEAPVFVKMDREVTVYCSDPDKISQFVVRDNCDDQVFLSFKEFLSTGNSCPQVYLRFWEAVDPCGNRSTFIQRIILIDTLAPQPFSIPQDKTISCEDPMEFDIVTFRDDCSSFRLSSREEVSYEECVTIYTKTWTAIDACDNETVITQQIRVTDDAGPVWDNLPPDTIFSETLELAKDSLTATDNCSDVSIEYKETSEGPCALNVRREWTALDGCGNSTTFVQYIIDTTAISLDIEVSNVSCSGDPGFAEAHVSGGKIPYSYHWSTGDTTERIGGLEEGVYSVTVYDGNGCQIEATKEVAVGGEKIEVEVTIKGTSCLSVSGEAKFAVSGGVPPFIFTWDDGYSDSTSSRVSLERGLYRVAVTDSVGCTEVIEVEIPYDRKCTGKVGDLVWEDFNANGLQDPFEPGIAEIELILMSEDHREITRTKSDLLGLYSFTGIAPGNYYIRLGEAGFYRPSVSSDKNGVHDNDMHAETRETSVFRINFRSTLDEIDIGLYRPVGIGDRIWLDLDSDCVADANEVGFADVDVILLDENLTTIEHQKTDERGLYRFENVSPGDYFVAITAPPGYEPCQSAGQLLYEILGPQQIRSPKITLLSGQSIDVMDFGIKPSQSCDLQVIFDVQHALCGQPTGSVKLNIIGCGPFTYQWSTGETTSSIHNLSPGVYTIIVKDTYGKQAIKDIFILDEPGDLGAEIVDFQVPDCDGSNGFIQVQGYGGIAPYSYHWLDSTQSNFAEHLTEGTYTVIVKDLLGCEVVLTHELNESEECDETVDIELGVFLEGPYDAASGKMISTLGVNGYLPGQESKTLFGTSTPTGQPYSEEPWNYFGDEGQGISDYPENFIDWILVGLRKDVRMESEVCRFAAFLMDDGSVEFLDQSLPCPLEDSTKYFVTIEHRNHVVVMSKEPVEVTGGMIRYDFRIQDSYKSLFGSGQKVLKRGVFGMIAGNVDQSRYPSSVTDINFSDILKIQRQSGQNSSYLSGDVDLNGDVNVKDVKISIENLGLFSDVPKM